MLEMIASAIIELYISLRHCTDPRLGSTTKTTHDAHNDLHRILRLTTTCKIKRYNLPYCCIVISFMQKTQIDYRKERLPLHESDSEVFFVNFILFIFSIDKDE